MDDTNGYDPVNLEYPHIGVSGPYDLELQRHDAEIQYLHRRPQYEVCFQRRQVHILKLPRHSSPAPTLRNRHKRKERRQSHGREDQLVEAHALQRGDRGVLLGDGEGAVEEGEPVVLHGRDEEAVAHEAGEALEVELGREVAAGVGELEGGVGVLLVVVGHFDAVGDVFSGAGGGSF